MASGGMAATSASDGSADAGAGAAAAVRVPTRVVGASAICGAQGMFQGECNAIACIAHAHSHPSGEVNANLVQHL